MTAALLSFFTTETLVYEPQVAAPPAATPFLFDSVLFEAGTEIPEVEQDADSTLPWSGLTPEAFAASSSRPWATLLPQGADWIEPGRKESARTEAGWGEAGWGEAGWGEAGWGEAECTEAECTEARSAEARWTAGGAPAAASPERMPQPVSLEAPPDGPSSRVPEPASLTTGTFTWKAGAEEAHRTSSAASPATAPRLALPHTTAAEAGPDSAAEPPQAPRTEVRLQGQSVAAPVLPDKADRRDIGTAAVPYLEPPAAPEIQLRAEPRRERAGSAAAPAGTSTPRQPSPDPEGSASAVPVSAAPVTRVWAGGPPRSTRPGALGPPALGIRVPPGSAPQQTFLPLRAVPVPEPLGPPEPDPAGVPRRRASESGAARPAAGGQPDVPLPVTPAFREAWDGILRQVRLERDAPAETPRVREVQPTVAGVAPAEPGTPGTPAPRETPGVRLPGRQSAERAEPVPAEKPWRDPLPSFAVRLRPREGHGPEAEPRAHPLAAPGESIEDGTQPERAGLTAAPGPRAFSGRQPAGVAGQAEWQQPVQQIAHPAPEPRAPGVRPPAPEPSGRSAEPAPAPHPRGEDATGAPLPKAAPRVTLTVPGRTLGATSSDPVALHFYERRGEIRLLVRTPDRMAAHEIRQDVQGLVERLDAAGFDAELWRPRAPEDAGEPSRRHGREQGHSGDGEPSEGRGQRDGRRDEDASRWAEAFARFEELEQTGLKDRKRKDPA